MFMYRMDPPIVPSGNDSVLLGLLIFNGSDFFGLGSLGPASGIGAASEGAAGGNVGSEGNIGDDRP